MTEAQCLACINQLLIMFSTSDNVICFNIKNKFNFTSFYVRSSLLCICSFLRHFDSLAGVSVLIPIHVYWEHDYGSNILAHLRKGASELFCSQFVRRCCRRRKLFTFSSFSPEPLGQFKPNIAQSILGWSRFKFIQTKGPALFHGEIITNTELN